MCEANVYLVKDGYEKVVMESVDVLRREDDCIFIESLFGERLKIKAHIKEMNLVDHRILLAED